MNEHNKIQAAKAADTSEKNKQSDKISTARKIFAWVIGILVWTLSASIADYLGLSDVSPNMFGEDTERYWITLLIWTIMSIMLSVRTGMAIYTGKLNGNVSPSGNSLFTRFMIFFLIMGMLSAPVEIFIFTYFAKIFGEYSFLMFLIWLLYMVLFIGIGMSLLKALGIFYFLGMESVYTGFEIFRPKIQLKDDKGGKRIPSPWR